GFVLGDREAWLRLTDRRALLPVPAPGVAEPESWQQVQLGVVRPAVVDLDPHVQVLDAVLGVLDEDVEVPILGEHAGIENLDLAPVADSGQAVLVPAIRARAGVVVREVIPRRAVRAVILADGAPGALGEVRPPALPVLGALA